ncbi:MAG: tetratricopeptide repeat protein [Lachnospiraceae bacterium]|nr:tetratricopeptide repeat protein [Lachnospiraceae bacterium]
MRKITLAVAALAAVAVLSGCSKKDEKYSEAKRLMNAGSYSQAQPLYEEATANHNADAEFYVDMGYNCLGLQKYVTAEECFNHAISMEKELEEAYRGLGISCYEQGKLSDAITAFNKAIEQVNSQVQALEYDILEYRGDCEARLMKYDEAIKTYDALIELGVHREDQYINKGRIYLAMNNTDEATECFNKVIEKKGNDVEMYFAIYQSYVENGFTDEGVKYLSKALEVKGDSAEAHLYRGKIYYLMGNNSAALTELQYPMEEGIHEAALYEAFCYEAMGDTDKAEVIYKEELTKNYDPEMANYFALCLSRKGDYNTAWNVVHKAISDYPDCACIRDLLWNEVVLYEKMGYYPSAYTHLLEYQSRYPGDSLVQQELEFLLMKIG